MSNLKNEKVESIVKYDKAVLAEMVYIFSKHFKESGKENSLKVCNIRLHLDLVNDTFQLDLTEPFTNDHDLVKINNSVSLGQHIQRGPELISLLEWMTEISRFAIRVLSERPFKSPTDEK